MRESDLELRKSRAVVVGASSGVGRALGTSLARRGHDLVLVSRDARDLEATAADLSLRHGIQCRWVAQDIADPTWDVSDFVRDCVQGGRVDVVLIPAGGVLAADVAPNADVIRPVFETNCLGPARIAAAFGQQMGDQGGGSIVLFSSIAAAAPRAKNAAYSAAKAALEVYAKALRHGLAAKRVEVLVVALGYVDTSQTFGLRLLFPTVSPECVADHLAKRLGAYPVRGGKHYYPRFWWSVTAALRLLPWVLYRRLQF